MLGLWFCALEYENHNVTLDTMSADNDKGQCRCVTDPEEWKTNLATARPTFASPHNKRQRKKLAVFKGKETSHEPFLNGQSNVLHLHIMNGPYYSKSKCRLWDKAGCWMLIWDQEAADEGISTFFPQSNTHRLPDCPEEMALCQPRDWT